MSILEIIVGGCLIFVLIMFIFIIINSNIGVATYKGAKHYVYDIYDPYVNYYCPIRQEYYSPSHYYMLTGRDVRQSMEQEKPKKILIGGKLL